MVADTGVHGHLPGNASGHEKPGRVKERYTPKAFSEGWAASVGLLISGTVRH